MANTILQTRIQLKYDTYTNWQTNNPILKKGEIGIAEVPAGSGAAQNEPAVLIKVGNGESNWKDLKYITGLAGDVYAWAKAAQKPSYTAQEISGLETFISGQIQDTDTQYKIEQDQTDGHKFYLYSKTKNGSWGTTPVSTITIPEKTYTLLSGTANGTVKFNGTDVSVTGLKSAAYTDASAYDPKGTGATEAAKVLGSTGDAASAATVYGAKAAAAAAQSTANAAMPKSGGTFTGAVTLAGAPTADLQAATKKYVDDAKTAAAADATSKANAAQAAAATDASSKANQALSDAKAYADQKTAGLTGAMHYKGAVEAWPPTGSYAAGDVVIFSSKEYVYDGKEWRELGDENSFVLKTTTVNGHALSGNITLTAGDVGAAVAADITNAINALDATTVGGAGRYIQSVSETNGIISATAANLPTALKNPNALTVGAKTYDGSAAVTITAADLGAVTDISGKQDNLTFDGTYNASTNKVATVSTVTNAIGALDVSDAAVAGQVVSAVSETDGKIAITRRALVTADIPTLPASKISGLATVATSGKIDDLTQTAYVVFDCGSSSTVI